MKFEIGRCISYIGKFEIPNREICSKIAVGLDSENRFKYLIVGLVFSHLGFWSGSLFLIALFLIFAYLYFFLAKRGKKRQKEAFYYSIEIKYA